MGPINYGLLEQVDEDAFHRSRLLNVEWKSFARIAKRMTSNDSFVYAKSRDYPTPPPDGEAVDEQASLAEAHRRERDVARNTFREEILLETINMEGAMLRSQLMGRSNEAERNRYATERVKIIETAGRVRDNTVDLRTQLVGSQRTMARRKGFDEQADKSIRQKQLKSRSEQLASIERLHAEIEEQEREVRGFIHNWRARHVQLGKIIAEGRQMRALLEDDQEPEWDEETEEAGLDERSKIGTPLPGSPGGATPRLMLDVDRPSSPARSTQNEPRATGLVFASAASRSSSQTRQTVRLRPVDAPEPNSLVSAAQSPLPSATSVLEEGEDVEMVESGEVESEEGQVESGEVEPGDASATTTGEDHDMET